MKRLSFVLFLFINIASLAQTKVSDIADISIEMPYGFHFITDAECKLFNLPANSTAWVCEIASESELFDTRQMLGLINNDIFKCYYNVDVFKALNTPLKRKQFIGSEDYEEYNLYFVKERELLLNSPVTFHITNLSRYASDYDIDRGGFYVKIPFLFTNANKSFFGPGIFPWHLLPNGEIKFTIPKKILKKHFKPDYYNSAGISHDKFYLNEFFIPIANEDIALKIENETDKRQDFEIILVSHFSPKESGFIIDDIILFHKPTEFVVWSFSKGDLSKGLKL